MTPDESPYLHEVRGGIHVPPLLPLLIRLVAAMCMALLAVRCVSVPPEQRLRVTIATGIEAAERTDHEELAGLVSKTYADARGRDRRGLLNLVRGYLSQLGPLHIFSVEESLVITSPGRAQVTLLVAVASVPMESLADLRQTTADLGRVELTMVEEGGDWKLVEASWRQADLADFL